MKQSQLFGLLLFFAVVSLVILFYVSSLVSLIIAAIVIFISVARWKTKSVVNFLAFVVAITSIAINIAVFNNDFGSMNSIMDGGDTALYHELELNFEAIAEAMAYDGTLSFPDQSTKLVITKKKMIELNSDASNVFSGNMEACDGYVIVTNNGIRPQCDAYIVCGNKYKTSGYSKKTLEEN